MRIKTNDKYISLALKNRYENLSHEIKLTAILSKVYASKISSEIVNTKVNNQLNSIEFSISQITPKFNEKSKNYDKIKEEMLNTLNNYEQVLKKICDTYDKKIDEIILKKFELEINLMMLNIRECYFDKIEQNQPFGKGIINGINTVIDKIKGKLNKNEPLDVSLINRLQDGKDIAEEMNHSEVKQENDIGIEKEISELNKKIKEMNKEKLDKIMKALEVGDKAISTELRKPRTFKRITKFFANRFNPYKAIMKNVIEPLNQRIDELKVNESVNQEFEEEQIDLQKFEEEIRLIQRNIIGAEENKWICERFEIEI